MRTCLYLWAQVGDAPYIVEAYFVVYLRHTRLGSPPLAFCSTSTIPNTPRVECLQATNHKYHNSSCTLCCRFLFGPKTWHRVDFAALSWLHTAFNSAHWHAISMGTLTMQAYLRESGLVWGHPCWSYPGRAVLVVLNSARGHTLGLCLSNFTSHRYESPHNILLT